MEKAREAYLRHQNNTPNLKKLIYGQGKMPGNICSRVDFKAILHDAIFAATCNAISDIEQRYLKGCRREIVHLVKISQGNRHVHMHPRNLDRNTPKI
jgi:hypothetical protein